MKLECPDCQSVVTAKGNGAVRCPNCGFTSKVSQKRAPPAPKLPPARPAPAPRGPPQSRPAQPAPHARQASPGTPILSDSGQHHHTAPPGANGLAIASLVMGIVGLCMAPIAIGALVTGIISLNQCKQTGQEGEGMAITGIVLGSIGLLSLAFIFGPLFWF